MKKMAMRKTNLSSLGIVNFSLRFGKERHRVWRFVILQLHVTPRAVDTWDMAGGVLNLAPRVETRFIIHS